MAEWDVVLVIGTLITLGSVLWKASSSYSKTTVQLQETIKSLQDLINRLQDDLIANSKNNSDSHRRIFQWLEKHDEELDEHGKQIIKLEVNLKGGEGKCKN